MEYSEIKSAYIKNLLQETSWQDHKKVDDLIKLHNYIINHPKSFIPGMHYTHLMQQYDNEFLVLLKEYSEQAYDIEIKKRNAFRDRLIIEEKKEEEIIVNQRNEWIKAGGKP
jgi:hypothetical protein